MFREGQSFGSRGLVIGLLRMLNLLLCILGNKRCRRLVYCNYCKVDLLGYIFLRLAPHRNFLSIESIFLLMDQFLDNSNPFLQ